MAIQIVPASVTESPPTPQPPALVLFGRNRSGKPCAAWFDGDQAEAATAAAATMKLRVLPVAGDEERALATQLGRGRILSNGKAHVPAARRDLYGRLVAQAGDNAGLNITERPEQRGAPAAVARGESGADETRPPAPAGALEGADRGRAVTAAAGATAAADGPAKPKFGDHNFVGSSIPRERDEIGLGSLVLAHEGVDDGWWEAEVIGMNGRVFSLRWRDYPQQGTILRQPGELALMPPGKV
ncbi:hypothetical protein [Methylobacterium thuringiense]|uniref:Uncharacterized protein n=1 Tax=Methylobacterium thuringiense TaxID=1003091 RepID=A0ABQ4TQV0_9HYPH|nr:hypothetical protein [Methylobacterium thuringiense]GJE57734.1 hypothetical protein EKPJFOCH_4252 [Methylobacterium thuringiense]